MNIVYLISNIRSCGPLNVMNGIINNINEKNINIISIFGDRDNQKIISEYKSMGINVYSLNLTKTKYIFKGKKKLYKLLNEIKPDVINSHGIIPDLLVCRLKKFYRVSTVHSNIYEDYLNRFGKIKGRIYIKMHEYALKRINKVVAVAEFISVIFNKKGINATYIRNGVKIPNIKNQQQIKNDVKKELCIPNDSIIYIFCGSLYASKGVLELVRMFNRYHNDNEYLIIMGNGSEKNKIEKEKGEHVIMLGHIPNVSKYYIAADIYVSNSFTEGFSISVLEALSMHNLLLLSDIPSHNECINIDKNIYLGEIFNDSTFLKKKEEISSNIGKFDERIINKISDKMMAKKYKEIYEENL